MHPSQVSRLSMMFIVGQDEEGANIIQTKTLNNVKGTATDEELVQIVQSLTSLQQFSLADAKRNNSYSLM